MTHTLYFSQCVLLRNPLPVESAVSAYMTGSSHFVINWRWTNACPSAAPLRTAHSLSVPGMRYSAV